MWRILSSHLLQQVRGRVLSITPFCRDISPPRRVESQSLIRVFKRPESPLISQIDQAAKHKDNHLISGNFLSPFEGPQSMHLSSSPKSCLLRHQIPCPIPGLGPAPVSKQHKRRLPALHEKIEARDESIISNVPNAYYFALASAKDKHLTQMAKVEQELEKLGEKVKLYEDFLLKLEASRSSSFIVGGQREGRGRPKSLEELKERLESQLRVMKAEEMAKGSGWF